MSRFLLLALALTASFASSELAVERELSSDDDYGYDSGKGGMMSGGMMSGKGGMMSGKGYYEPEEPVFPAPTSPPLEPCVCVEICDEPEMDDDSGKGGMMSGMMSGKGKGGRQLMMGKGGYDDDYTAEPVCYEECTGDCYPEPPALECCEYESVCEEEPEEGKGKGGMMSGMMSGRQLMMGKGGYGYDDDSSSVCEDVCVKYCPPDEPIYTFTPGDGDMCYDTASYTTGDDCVCNCECCMDEVEYPEEDDDGKGGMMSGKGGMMSGKGHRQLMMGKGGMMSGKGHYEEPDASFSCACGCACPESVPVPEPSPSPSGKGMMGMMSGKGGKGKGGKGKGSEGGKGSDEGKDSSGDGDSDGKGNTSDCCEYERTCEGHDCHYACVKHC